MIPLVRWEVLDDGVLAASNTACGFLVSVEVGLGGITLELAPEEAKHGRGCLDGVRLAFERPLIEEVPP